MVTPKDFFHRLTKIKNYITNPHDNIEVRNERLSSGIICSFQLMGEDLNKFVCKWCVCPSHLTPPQCSREKRMNKKYGAGTP